jgi:hypothetical protein
MCQLNPRCMARSTKAIIVQRVPGLGLLAVALTVNWVSTQ